MKVKTATIELKLDKIGITVTRRGVTPAELMFLVADHHSKAGGDPVVSLVIEKKMEEGQVQEKDPTGKGMVKDGKPVMKLGLVPTEEDNEIECTPGQERKRLQGMYGAKRIAKFYPGPMPTMPTTFEEAREAGISSESPTERLLTVGEEAGKE